MFLGFHKKTAIFSGWQAIFFFFAKRKKSGKKHKKGAKKTQDGQLWLWSTTRASKFRRFTTFSASGDTLFNRHE